MGKSILTSLLCICLIPVTQAEIYKWVDEKGQTHYGEKPSASQRSKKINVRDIGKTTNHSNKQSKDVSQEDKRARLLRAFEEERNLKKEQQQQDRQQTAQRKRNCGISKDKLRRYKSVSKVYDVDENGKRIFLPDSEREKSIQLARQAVKRWCN